MITRTPIAERQLAVLIDFENTGLKSIQWLFDQVSDIGRIIVKRAYADWSVEADKRDQLLELGIEPVHLFHSSGGGKNSSDIRLAIDAIELLHQSPVDTFIIVSSDSDFVPLVSKLRSAGKTVIGAGREAITSRTLVRSCDRYFYLEQSDKVPSTEPSPQEERHKEQVDQLLMRAVRAAIDEQGSWTVVLAWSKRANKSEQSIPGPTAAMDAARVLDAPKLSASPYKTLQSLLEASDTLHTKWSRDKNTIVRR